MGQRRERPPEQRSGRAVGLRLPDGRSLSMPVETSREPEGAGVCCFCAAAVDVASAENVRMEVRWAGPGGEHAQALSAHRACLLDRLHEGVRSGPLFGAG